ncbi:unnamed protein product [Brassica oleracea var. botrytis]
MKALRRIQTRSSFPNPSSPLFSSSPSSPWTHLRSALVLVTSSSPASSSSSSNPHRLKSPWSRFKRKKPLTLRRWKRCFTPDGRLRKRGVYLLKKVRSRGIDPSIRSEVWPFLLGVCDLNSSKEERGATREGERTHMNLTLKIIIFFMLTFQNAEKRMRDYAGNAKSFRDKTEVSLPMIFLMNSLSNHRLFELTLLEQRSTIKVPTPVVIIDQDSDPDATVVEANVYLESFGKHNKFAITKAQHELRPNNLRNLQETESVVTEVRKTFDQSRKRSLR